VTVSVLTRDPALQDAVVQAVERLGYEARRLAGGSDFASDASVAAGILDDGLPNLAATVAAFRERLPRAGLVVLSGRSGPGAVIDALGLGADEVLRKPFDLSALARALSSATRLRRPAPAPRVVAADARTRALLARLVRVADTDLTLTLAGEMGTGKSLLARWLHGRSRRSGAPLTEVSALDLDADCCLTELWGDPGDPSRPGRFLQAHGGTLVLDGVDDFPAPAQQALLALLQGERCEVDARVIAIARRSLEELAHCEALCEPLLRRLEVVQIEVPPLRERPDDVAILAEAFLERFARELSQPRARLGPDALSALRSRAWRGNVRELENLMARAALAFSGSEVPVDWLDGAPRPPGEAPARGLNLGQLERSAIARALHLSGGRRTEAARALGISVRTLRNKIRKHELQ
jgi:DNA-binding NtrC family response regulator